MRKKLYHAIVHYEWRTARYVKGIYKPSKKWSKANYETVVSTLSLDVINSDSRFLNKLSIKHKSSNDVEVKVTEIIKLKYLCMSNDIY
jgi:hypothetical protein